MPVAASVQVRLRDRSATAHPQFMDAAGFARLRGHWSDRLSLDFGFALVSWADALLAGEGFAVGASPSFMTPSSHVCLGVVDLDAADPDALADALSRATAQAVTRSAGVLSGSVLVHHAGQVLWQPWPFEPVVSGTPADVHTCLQAGMTAQPRPAFEWLVGFAARFHAGRKRVVVVVAPLPVFTSLVQQFCPALAKDAPQVRALAAEGGPQCVSIGPFAVTPVEDDVDVVTLMLNSAAIGGGGSMDVVQVACVEGNAQMAGRWDVQDAYARLRGEGLEPGPARLAVDLTRPGV